MSRCYIFHGDQVTELPHWPGTQALPVGSWVYRPDHVEGEQWYAIYQNHPLNLNGYGGHEWCHPPIGLIPTLYRAKALLLT